MKFHLTTNPLLAGLSRRLALPTLLALLLAAGCGGGVGTGGTGSFAAGPITGFGSVIVNDVRFDDQAAQVEDGEGNRLGRDDLRLGMTVEIDADAIASSAGVATATARRIRVDSELRGPVSAVDVAGGSFTALGQRVLVDATTVFDERISSGLQGLAPGVTVQVYALFDATTGGYRATRVEPASAALPLRLRGVVAAVDATAQTLRIGNTSYSIAGATGVPAGLAPGVYVNLRLTATGQPAGRFAALSFGLALPALGDADGIKVKGLVTAFSSLGSFAINGRAVSASGAQFPNGTALAVGVRVEIEGQVRNGELVASKVSVLSDQQERERGFELIGSITAVDSQARTIVLRGVTVGTARPDLRYQNGTAADLAVGRRVQLKGLLSTDGRRIEATEIRFE